MSPSNQAQLQSLRLEYSAAYTADRSCVEALSNARMDGRTPSPEPLRKEASALRALTGASANLLGAMRDDPQRLGSSDDL